MAVFKTLTGKTQREKNVYRDIRRILIDAFYKERVLFDKGVKRLWKCQVVFSCIGYYPMIFSWRIFFALLRIRKM